MNIVMQGCGLAILLVILYFFVGYKWKQINTSVAFFSLLITTIICTVLDMISVFVLVNNGDFPKLFVNVICKLYLVSLVFVTYGALNYTYVDIYKNDKIRRMKILPQKIICATGCVMIVCLPVQWFVEGNVVYSYGPSALATYALGLYFIWLSFHMVIRKGHIMNNRRQKAVKIWVIIWTTAAVIQFFVKSLLIVSFAAALGVVIVYLILENPDSYVDKITGLCNMNAASEFVKQMYANNRNFSMYMIVLDNVSIFRKNKSGRKRWSSAYDNFLIFLDELPGAYIFCDGDDQILLFFDDKKKAKEAKKKIDYKVNCEWKKEYAEYAKAKWFFVPEGNFTKDEYSYMLLLKYARQNNADIVRKNTVLVDGNMFEKMIEDKMIESLIVDSIEKKRIEVFYQPIFSTKKNKFVSAEALVRLRDEKGDIIPPGKFISVAEENGTILILGEIIFEKVCRFINSEVYKKLGLEYIEINLSVVQCGYKHLANDFIEIMQRHKIDPKSINLEITESASIVGKDILKNNMEKLMDFGVNFSLDDFGTGQSNLNYIAEMPVEIVKFDRSMILAYFENEKAKYVLNAAMSMIKGMELGIVSEGIETEEQYNTMRKLGIDYIQGYYFSKPLPEDEFVKFILDNKNKLYM